MRLNEPLKADSDLWIQRQSMSIPGWRNGMNIGMEIGNQKISWNTESGEFY